MTIGNNNKMMMISEFCSGRPAGNLQFPRIPAILLSLAAIVCSGEAATGRATTAPPPDPLYSAVPDDAYLQEIGEKIATRDAVAAIAVHEGNLVAVIEKSLHTLQAGKLVPTRDVPAAVQRVFSLGGDLWCTTDKAVYRIENGTAEKVFDGAMVDLCLHLGEVHGATSDGVYRLENGTFVNIKPPGGWLTTNTTMIMEDGSQVLTDPVQLGPIERIASYSGTLYLLGSAGLALLDGPVFVNSPVDWGVLPSNVHRDMLAHGSRLLIATDRGVAVIRGTALTTLTGTDGLPYEDTSCLAAGFDGDLWIGTSAGAIRKVGADYHFFSAEHWLPGNQVHDIAVDGRTVYVATDKGIGIIRYEPYTLLAKAAYFERNIEERGHKRLGFVHQLYQDGAGNWLREISDNDGGHTAHYLAAMCFKYAVTQDEPARRAAVDSFEAMRWLQTVTGTDGFFARAIWANGYDQGHRLTSGSGGLPAKWYETDDGVWQWKGDTSSDEVNAHFYAVSLFHDLVAKGDEKDRAAEHLARIAGHILDNGWVLRDMDGRPTRWGRWDPDYLLRPYGFASRGLNGMEAQTYMWTAFQLTRDPRFKEGLDQLIDWRYHTYTVREKLTFPPEDVVPWDDELAFRCFHPLLTYCDDPYLRSIYLRALERHWEVLRMQKLPFFNFMYGGLTGNDCEAPEAVQHLREWSLDTVSHSFRNSHRADLAPEPGYTPYVGVSRSISPREQACNWGSRWTIEYDGDRGGRIITPPAGWLEDYWMGRYYGMIAAPTVAVSEVSVSIRGSDLIRALPYTGPERPPD